MVKGFKFGAVEAGIKYENRLDLGLIHSEVPANAIGFFTTNEIKAAPVKVSQPRLAGGWLQSVIVNSGNANACTGPQGLEDAETMIRETAQGLGVDPSLVAVCSTGVIGRPMPMTKLNSALPGLIKGLSTDGLDDLARAIMTTDTVPKISVAEMDLDGKPATLAGICKGSGMIHPNLEPVQGARLPEATMLAFLMTDAAIAPGALQEAMADVLPSSFHGLTIDGDTSTNDTLLLMANGAAGNVAIENYGSPGGSDFYGAVRKVCIDLAEQLVADAEGGTKVVTIRVLGAGSEMEADMVVMAIALSPLCKTAFFGQDPNWGRIICAAGYSGARVDEDQIEILFDDVPVFAQGMPTNRETEAEAVMAKEAFTVTVNLNMGTDQREFKTSDLSLDYVRINSEYTT